MILEFISKNYRPFYGKKTLVLEADKALKECSETNLFDYNKLSILNTQMLVMQIKIHTQQFIDL